VTVTGDDTRKDRDTHGDGRALRGEELRSQGRYLQRDDPEQAGTDQGVDGDDRVLSALPQAAGQEVDRDVTT